MEYEKNTKVLEKYQEQLKLDLHEKKTNYS